MPIGPQGGAHGGNPDQDCRIAILTMVYNERTNLPIWAGYYRRAAPGATLFVVDHGSDDGSTADLSGINRIPLPRRQMDEHDRSFLITSLQHGLLRYFDVVIYTDCDEFLVPDPVISPTLEAHLAARRYPYASPVGIEIVHIFDVEPAIDFAQPLLRQRRFGQFHSVMCKPLVTRVPLTWQPGFHTADRPVNIDRHLYLLHIKQIDKDEAMRRQQQLRRVPWSEAAMQANHGAHHRYDDERFIREFFLDPANQFKQLGPQDFMFEAEIAKLRQTTQEVSGIYHILDFKGPIVELPERFRAAF